MNTHPQDNSTQWEVPGVLIFYPPPVMLRTARGHLISWEPDLPHKQAEKDTVAGTRPLIKRTLRVTAQGFCKAQAGATLRDSEGEEKNWEQPF